MPATMSMAGFTLRIRRDSTMDKNMLHDLATLTKALKTTIIRSQNGIAGLQNLSKLGQATMSASAPNIFAELRQLEAETQHLLKAYRDQLSKASLSTSKTLEEETQQ
jgi:hypothetical protein